MIFALVEFVCLLILGGFLFFCLDGVAMDYLDSQLALYPTAFTNEAVLFTRLVVHWLLFIMLLGGVYSLIVWSLRTRPEGYYR